VLVELRFAGVGGGGGTRRETQRRRRQKWYPVKKRGGHVVSGYKGVSDVVSGVISGGKRSVLEGETGRRREGERGGKMKEREGKEESPTRRFYFWSISGDTMSPLLVKKVRRVNSRWIKPRINGQDWICRWLVGYEY